ncbi:hypothetical protein F4823DRAFT_631769 [Ustulina deusta]|nr:hypothetical protein F4823DRAFT_631769 [Ustulina deusta]
MEVSFDVITLPSEGMSIVAWRVYHAFVDDGDPFAHLKKVSAAILTPAGKVDYKEITSKCSSKFAEANEPIATCPCTGPKRDPLCTGRHRYQRDVRLHGSGSEQSTAVTSHRIAPLGNNKTSPIGRDWFLKYEHYSAGDEAGKPMAAVQEVSQHAVSCAIPWYYILKATGADKDKTRLYPNHPLLDIIVAFHDDRANAKDK